MLRYGTVTGSNSWFFLHTSTHSARSSVDRPCRVPLSIWSCWTQTRNDGAPTPIHGHNGCRHCGCQGLDAQGRGLASEKRLRPCSGGGLPQLRLAIVEHPGWWWMDSAHGASEQNAARLVRCRSTARATRRIRRPSSCTTVYWKYEHSRRTDPWRTSSCRSIPGRVGPTGWHISTSRESLRTGPYQSDDSDHRTTPQRLSGAHAPQ